MASIKLEILSVTETKRAAWRLIQGSQIFKEMGLYLKFLKILELR